MDPEKKKSRGQRRRAAIVAAAMALVVERGAHALTMAELADALGVTAGALYRYYPSKEHILAAVEAEMLGHIATSFTAVVHETATRPPLEQLVAIVDAYAMLEAKRSQQFLLLSRFLGSDVLLPDELAADLLAPAVELLGVLSRALESAIEDGALDPGNSFERAMVLWSAVHGVLERRKLTRLAPKQLDLARLLRATADALLVGWGAESTALQPIWTSRLPRLRTHYAKYFEAPV